MGDDFTDLVSYLLSSVGLTVLLVWPQGGPGAWLRDRVLKKLLPGRAGQVFDCYICLGFWVALALSPLWWWFTRRWWCWAGCLMTPAVFWLVLNPRE